MNASFRRFLLGSPLPTAEEAHQRLTKIKALAVCSSDALSSVAYSTEEILLVLVVAGSSGLGLLLPIALTIHVLLAVVATSYHQTIHGYPSGGGAYIVARDNLGVWPGLTAAAALLIGITFLARSAGVVPVEEETIASQVGRQVFGSGAASPSLQIATTLILILAANTVFADFPRLAAILARDRYPPHQLSNLGDRLVFTNGIAVSAFLASSLVIIFDDQTHWLIPLYAAGVFLSFTLSQTGMVYH